MSAERRSRDLDSCNCAGIGAVLLASGVAVQDGFLPPSRVRELIRCARLRRDRGDFGEARIGADRMLQRRESLRGDRTCWIAPLPHTPLFPAESALLADLERLRVELNRRGLLGLFDLELHHAWYPPGASYARHVDQPQGREHRVVSMVLYLNDDWRPDDGGELRIFDATAANGTVADATTANETAARETAADVTAARDIAPVAGRLVCFLTAGREHAVLRCRRERASISGWFRRRNSCEGRARD